ncbi:DUF222 domain-containing protein [Microlunatus elymi]|uniref:DUF222 domain-containing protein n=1 Tax=Microlunatus elymi TaxID=2596828 RepID=A0A516Q3P6_9ACTN|nr:DUF222 domain-containing protein [Microlunatus elymi]QDP97841.1 DUF222 domain-containing protein [Microlunatus elymi]
MSESSVAGLGARESLALLSTSRTARRRSECDDLIVVAHYADLHPPQLLEGRPVVRGMERAIRLGGEGTPAVTEFCAVELGAALGLSDRQARELIADVLDLRHRLPRLWELVLRGIAPVDRLREIARRTRTLAAEAARAVDGEVVGYVNSLSSWGRLFDAVDAAILRADPERAKRMAKQARDGRYVKISSRSRYGTRTVSARIDADYAVWMQATIDTLTKTITGPTGLPAEVGDRHCEEPEEFQAQAFGLMGLPLLSTRLLAQQQHPDLFTTEAGQQYDTTTTHHDRHDHDQPHQDDHDHEPGNRGHDETPAGEAGRTAGGKHSHTKDPNHPDWPEDQQPADHCRHPRRNDDAAHGKLPPSTETATGDRETVITDDRESPREHDHESTSRDGYGLLGYEVDHGDLRRVPIPVNPDPRLSRDTAFWLARINPTKLLPKVILHVHITTDTAATGRGVARVEGIGPILATQVRDWLGNGCRIRLQPVLDPADIHPVDAYETPDRMRDALLARTPASCFPNSANRSRSMQADHTIPYVRTGGPSGNAPPGQTGLHNLGPLGETEHRIKTHGGWSVRQPVPGTYVWRTRYGRVVVVNDSGSHDLGDNPFAHAVWHAAVAADTDVGAGMDAGDDHPHRSDLEWAMQRMLEVA